MGLGDDDTLPKRIMGALFWRDARGWGVTGCARFDVALDRIDWSLTGALSDC